MHMHARSVVIEQRLGHECSRLVMEQCGIFYNVLVEQEIVGHLHQLVKSHINFTLPGGGYFMMMTFDGQSGLDHFSHHLISQLLDFIDWRNGNIPFFVPWPV